MRYTQLVQEQPYQIYALMQTSHPRTEIAAVVGVHKSTISREVRRNKGLRYYRTLQAHQTETISACWLVFPMEGVSRPFVRESCL